MTKFKTFNCCFVASGIQAGAIIFTRPRFAHIPAGNRLALVVEQRNGHGGPDSLTAAGPYLRLAGDVIGGWMLGRQALAAAGSEDPWLKGKLALARLYSGQVLSLAPGLAEGLTDGAADLEATPAAALAG